MNKHVKYIFYISLIGAIAMIAETLAGKTETMYYLKFNIAQAVIEVRLNDIPVLMHDAEGMLRSEKPVPESIINGENTLVVHMRPFAQDDTIFSYPRYAEIELIAREKNAPLNQGETVLQLKVSATEDPTRGLAGTNESQGQSPARITKHSATEIVAERKADIQSPFPRWAWQDGVTIEANDENFHSLLQEYKRIHKVLESEDMETIREVYSHAAREFSLAYHYDDIDEGHRIINTGGLVGDQEWVLGDIDALIDSFPLAIEVYANGKLAHIVDAENGGDSGIVYLHKEVKMVSFQKFGFYKTQDDEWVMIR